MQHNHSLTTKFLRITFSVMLLAMPQLLFAQDDMSDIHSDGQAIIQLLESKDLEVVRVEYDLIWNSPKEIIRSLSDKYTYAIGAHADNNRVDDLDIKVYRKSGSQWVLVAKDTDSDSTPMVYVKPESSGEYKIVISVYKFKSNYNIAHYGLFVAHD